LVLPFEKVLSLARPLRGQTEHSGNTSKQQADLGVRFIDVAREAGLNAKTIFGGEHKNKYLLETTGCGVAFYDYG
jgi:enediyne biosynthesis protein E4